MSQNHQDSSVNKLRSKLSEMFRLDQKDLDFGVYRIMNQRRNEISAFLDEDLLPQVHLELADQQSDQKMQIEAELKERVEKLKSRANVFMSFEKPKIESLSKPLNSRTRSDVTIPDVCL